MNSGSDLSKPFMPTYGEATAEGIKTQLDLLRGTGLFAGSGGLLGMLPYDTAVREATAQADTDVQRRQLLGGESRTKAEAITQADIDAPGSNLSQDDLGKFGIRKQELVIDQNLSSKEKARSVLNAFKEGVSPTPAMMQILSEAYPSVGENEMEALEATQYYGGWREDQFKSIFGEDNYADLNSVELEGQPQYTTNFVTQNPQTGQPYQEGESEKTSEGLIDILGDKRELEGMRADYGKYVLNNPDLAEQFQQMQASGSNLTAEEFGRKHYEEFGQAEGRELPETFGSLGRSAGYTEDGQFLGLSAFAEDVGRANISRQRTSDLNDVSRFAGQYKDIMEQFRDPNTPRTIGEIGGANDVFLNAMGGNAGATGEAGAEGTAGATPQPTGPGLRAMLASQATDALGQGLTDRERQRIQDSFKGQATMMGRTFDQSAGIREAEALVGESNQRKMQNRAFAQSVLGQEAGLRQAEISQAKANELDPFQAILGRPGGNPLQQAQGVLGQTSAGFQPGFNYLNPSAPLGYIQNNSANEMSAYNTALGAAATKDAGLIQGGATVLSSLIPSFKIGD
jgi:hypothetical protein